jgi:hypothetical protein
MRRLFALACLLAAACNGASKNPAADDLAVAQELEVDTLRPLEGELATVVFTIRNPTAQTAVLRDLLMAGSAGAVVTWQSSQPVSPRTREAYALDYVLGADEWKLDPRRAGKPRPVFNSGLLAPGESIVVRARIRLLGLPREFQLSYFLLSPEEVKRMVYFEFRRGGEVRYRKAIGDEIKTLLTPSSRPEPTSHRAVIFPHAEGPMNVPRLKLISVTTALTRRTFTIEMAAQKAGIPPPREHTYSSSLDGWVLGGEAPRLVTPAAVVLLPRLLQPERTFYYLDALGPGKAEVEFLRETKTLFGEKYRLVSDSSRARFFLFLERREILPFLADVRDAGLAVDLELTPEGGGRLLVTR